MRIDAIITELGIDEQNRHRSVATTIEWKLDAIVVSETGANSLAQVTVVDQGRDRAHHRASVAQPFASGAAERTVRPAQRGGVACDLGEVTFWVMDANIHRDACQYLKAEPTDTDSPVKRQRVSAEFLGLEDQLIGRGRLVDGVFGVVKASGSAGEC